MGARTADSADPGVHHGPVATHDRRSRDAHDRHALRCALELDARRPSFAVLWTVPEAGLRPREHDGRGGPIALHPFRRATLCAGVSKAGWPSPDVRLPRGFPDANLASTAQPSILGGVRVRNAVPVRL